MNDVNWRGASLLLFVASSIHSGSVIGQSEYMTSMAGREFKVVPKAERSELQKFAGWFHQDWQLLFSDLHQGAQMYVVGLKPERREALKKELDEFLKSHAGSDERELLDAWLRLGAEGWDSKLKVRSTLEDFSVMLGGEPLRT